MLNMSNELTPTVRRCNGVFRQSGSTVGSSSSDTREEKLSSKIPASLIYPHTHTQNNGNYRLVLILSKNIQKLKKKKYL